MENLELIIFDMDGLMFDTEKIAHRVWKEVLLKYSFPFTDEFYISMIGSNLNRIRNLCINEYGHDFPFDDIKIERYALTNQIIQSDGLPLKKGLIELLKYINTLPIKKAVATSSGKERADIFLSQSNITHYFDLILCGDEVTHSKPHPEIFLSVTKKLNCKPENTIVLEDSDAGINAAYSGNMKPILIPDIKKPSKEILEKTYKCFDSLLDVKLYLESNYK